MLLIGSFHGLFTVAAPTVGSDLPLKSFKKTCPRPPKPHFVALDYFIVLHILTQELPPHILWIRMSQNTGMWELLGNRGVQSATCTLGEQQLVLRRERF